MVLAGCGPGDEQCGQLVSFAGIGQAPPTVVGFSMETLRQAELLCLYEGPGWAAADEEGRARARADHQGQR